MATQENRALRGRLADRGTELDAALEASRVDKGACAAARKEVGALHERLSHAEDAAARAMADCAAAVEAAAAVKRAGEEEVARARGEAAAAASAGAQAAEMLTTFMTELERLRGASREAQARASKRLGAALLFTAFQARARVSAGRGMERWRLAVASAAAADGGVVVRLPVSDDGLQGLVKGLVRRVQPAERAQAAASASVKAHSAEVAELAAQLASMQAQAAASASDARSAHEERALAKQAADQESARAAVAFKQLKAIRGMLVAATQAQVVALKRGAAASAGARAGDPSGSPMSVISSASSIAGPTGRRAGRLESPSSPQFGGPADGLLSRRAREAFALSEPVDEEEGASRGAGAMPSAGTPSSWHHEVVGGPTLAAARAAIAKGGGTLLADATVVDGPPDPWYDSIRLLAHVHTEQKRARDLATELAVAREDTELAEATSSSLRATLVASREAEGAAVSAFVAEEQRRLVLQAVMQKLRLLHRADVDAAALVVSTAGNIAPAALLRGRAAGSTTAGSRDESLGLSFAPEATRAGRSFLRPGMGGAPAAAYATAARELLLELATSPAAAVAGAEAGDKSWTVAATLAKEAGNLTLSSLADSGLDGLAGGQGRSAFAAAVTQARFLAVVSARCEALDRQLSESDARESSIRTARGKLSLEVETQRLSIARLVAQLATVREQAATDHSTLSGEVARAKAASAGVAGLTDRLAAANRELDGAAAAVGAAQTAAASARAEAFRMAVELEAATAAAAVEAAGRERALEQLALVRRALTSTRIAESEQTEGTSAHAERLARAHDRVRELEKELDSASDSLAAAETEAASARSTAEDAARTLAHTLDKLERAVAERDGITAEREAERVRHASATRDLQAALVAAEGRLTSSFTTAARENSTVTASVLAVARDDAGRRLAAAQAARGEAAARAAIAEAEAAELRAKLALGQPSVSVLDGLRADAAAAASQRDEAAAQLSSLRVVAAGLRSELEKSGHEVGAARAVARAATLAAGGGTPRSSSGLESPGGESYGDAGLRSALAAKEEELASVRATADRARGILSATYEALTQRDSIVAGLERALAEQEAALADARRQIAREGSTGPVTSPGLLLLENLRDTITGLRADMEGAKEAVAHAAEQATGQAVHLANVTAQLNTVTSDAGRLGSLAAEHAGLAAGRQQRLVSLAAVIAGPLQAAVDASGEGRALHLQLGWPAVHEVTSLLGAAAAENAPRSPDAREDAVVLSQLLSGLAATSAAASGLLPSAHAPTYAPGQLAGLAETRAQTAQALATSASLSDAYNTTTTHLGSTSGMLLNTAAECLRLSEELAERTRQVNDLHSRLQWLEGPAEEKVEVRSDRGRDAVSPPLRPITPQRGAGGPFTPVRTPEDSPSAPFLPPSGRDFLLSPGFVPPTALGQSSEAASTLETQTRADLAGVLAALEAGPAALAGLGRAVREALEKGDPGAAAVAAQLAAQLMATQSVHSPSSPSRPLDTINEEGEDDPLTPPNPAGDGGTGSSATRVRPAIDLRLVDLLEGPPSDGRRVTFSPERLTSSRRELALTANGWGLDGVLTALEGLKP
jgi:hypothetical protein